MSRDEAKKLLGGYATGTLTPGEEQALFAAALDDQELFDALAREQALRDLLSDSSARGQVLAALDDRPQSWWQRATQWMMRPAVAGVAAACLAVVIGYGVWHAGQRSAPVRQATDNLALDRTAPAAPAPVPSPAPVSTAREEVRAATPPPKTESTLRVRTGGGGGGSGRRFAAEAARPTPKPAPPATLPPPPTVTGPPAQTRDTTMVDAALKSQAAPVQQAEAQAPQGQQQQQQTQAAPSMFRAAQQQQVVAVDAANAPRAALANLVVRVLRREADGTMMHISAEDIHAGDTIYLRLVPATEGRLSVAKAAQPEETLFPEQTVDKSKDIQLGPFTLDQPGSVALSVNFVPSPATERPMAFGGLATRRKAASPPPPPQTLTLVFK